MTHGEDSYTYDQARILKIDHPEEPYSQKAEVTLDNSDNVLTSIALKGFQGVISYGLKTTAGNEYSATAPLTVIGQRFDSSPGKLSCLLSLVGIPNLLSDDRAYSSYIPESTDTKTVKTLINEILGATLACFNHCTAYEIVYDSEDSLLDTYKPKDSIRIYVGTSRLAIVRRLLDFTKCVMRAEDDGKIHIFQPTISGTTYDYEYNLPSGHTLFSKAYQQRLVIPNYVTVKSQDDDDPQYSGYASDATSYALLPKKYPKQMRLESNAQAEDIAEAILSKYQLEAEGGAADVPLNVGQEVYDYIKVTDARQNDVRTGNIGYLQRHYSPKEWRMTFGFGAYFSMLSARKTLAELETYTDSGGYFDRLMVKDLFAENIKADNIDMVWLDPEGNIDLSLIGDNLDGLANGTTYARVKALHLDAGQIKLDENVYYASGYNPNTKRRNFTAEPTTPYDLGDMWTDGAVLKRCTTARATGAYQAADWTAVGIDEIADGTTYKRLLATQISAGKISLSDQCTYATGYNPNEKRRTFTATPTTPYDVGDLWMDASVVKRCTTARATGAYVAGDWTATTLDAIVNGTTYGRVAVTDISSGHILLSSTIKSGEWYNESGVEIDASHGINIYGTNNALTTRATKAGTIQCYVGTDGAIYAGAGAVKLDASGIIVTGQYLKLVNGAYYGWVYVGGTGDLNVMSYNGKVALTADSDIILQALSTYVKLASGTRLQSGGASTSDTSHLYDIHPYNASTWLGDSTEYFDRIYAGTYYGKTTTIQSFQKHDDIALVKAIKSKHIVRGKSDKSMKEAEEADVLDAESLPAEIRDGDFVIEGGLASLALGAIKKLIERVEALEAK